MLNEEDYPMTYKEFEKRVVELFLEDYSGDGLRIMKEKVEEELKQKPCFIEMLYAQSCFIYESPWLYGDTCKRCLEDNFLRQTPVANLRLFID